MCETVQMIVASHRDFYIVNKPVGLMVNDDLSASGERIPGLVSQLREALCETSLHPAHRLDKETSGLLIVARHRDSNAVFSRCFQARQIDKTYIAIASAGQGKNPKKKQGWIKGDMQIARNGSWRIAQTMKNPAITYFSSIALGSKKRLCILHPKTGKTHQLRVAMKALSMPIVGDLRYGGEKSDRMYLHAYSLCFEYLSKVYKYSISPSCGEFFNSPECIQYYSKHF